MQDVCVVHLLLHNNTVSEGKVSIVYLCAVIQAGSDPV